MPSKEKYREKTYNRVNFYFRLFPRWQFIERQFQAFSLDSESSRHSTSWGHPYIRMGCILNFWPHRQTLQLCGQNIKHNLSRHKCRRSQWNLKLISSSIIIPAYLLRTLRNIDSVQSGHSGRVEIIQSGIDVPTIESGDAFRLIFWRNVCLVEGDVVGMFQACFSKAFVVVYRTIADKLDLRHRRDCLKIRMENGFLGLASLVVSVAIALRLRIKSLRCIRVPCIQEIWDSTNLRECILLGRRQFDISEQKRTMLQSMLSSIEGRSIISRHTVYKADSISLNNSDPGVRSAGLTPLTSRPKFASLETSAEAGRGIGTSSIAISESKVKNDQIWNCVFSYISSADSMELVDYRDTAHCKSMLAPDHSYDARMCILITCMSNYWFLGEPNVRF